MILLQFCHILLSTAAECQAVSKRKTTRTLNKTLHNGNKNSLPEHKEKISSASMKGDGVHYENGNSITVDKKLSSKTSSHVKNSEDNSNTFTRLTKDTPSQETRQSSLSEARQQKQGDHPLREDSTDESADTKSASMEQIATVSDKTFLSSCIIDNRMIHNIILEVFDDQLGHCTNYA